MHLAQADLRSVRHDGLAIEFGILGPVAYILAIIPRTGSKGTSLEQPCERPHWGFVIDGDITVVQGRRRSAIGPGHAFHIPGGPPAHTVEASPGARIAGFEPVDLAVEPTDETLRAQGFEVTERERRPAVVPGVIAALVDPGTVDAEFHRMSSLVLTRARLGATSGYASEWCDLPHWGLVLAGGVALETEADVEVLATGDIFYCPPGPPGHRVLAADPATLLDLTPASAIDASVRMTGWRRPMLDVVSTPVAPGGSPSIAALI